MRRTSAVLVCVANCWIAAAQNQTIQSGSMTYGVGIKVQYVTVAEPALKQPGRLGFTGGSSFDAKVLHRWMLSESNRSYFGYDMLVEPIAGAGKCRVSILPL